MINLKITKVARQFPFIKTPKNAVDNPCVICPDGATVGDYFIPEYGRNYLTCLELIDGAKLFESGSEACRLLDVELAFCCPPVPNPAPTPVPIDDVPANN